MGYHVKPNGDGTFTHTFSQRTAKISRARKYARRTVGWLLDVSQYVVTPLECFARGHRWNGTTCSNCGKYMEDDDPNYYDR